MYIFGYVDCYPIVFGVFCFCLVAFCIVENRFLLSKGCLPNLDENIEESTVYFSKSFTPCFSSYNIYHDFNRLSGLLPQIVLIFST